MSVSIDLKSVEKRFGSVQVLNNVNLAIHDGEFIVFVGPSGCGKTTLLRIIAGLEDASSGDILIDHVRVNDVPASDRGAAMVFQSYALYPHMTVEENLSFGLHNMRMPRDEIQRRVKSAAELLQIDHLLARRPKALSGGQRQRVAIGRAISREPKVFLFDEPLSNLDAELRVQMRVELSKLHARLKSTMIYVTHDQVEAMTMADRIVVLRAGRVEQFGSPLELFNAPANKFVAGFIGSPRMNFISGRANAISGQGVTFVSDGLPSALIPAVGKSLEKSEPVTLGVRPEDFMLDAAGDAAWSAEVVVVEHHGSSSYIHCVLPAGQSIIVQEPGQTARREGDTLTLSPILHKTHLFRDADERTLYRL